MKEHNIVAFYKLQLTYYNYTEYDVIHKIYEYTNIVPAQK